MKQRLTAILLLFILVTPVVTLYVFMQYEKKNIQRAIKWKMIAGIDQEQLVLLKFTKKETETKLNWKHSKEFEYDGQMYDIVSKEIIGDTIHYRCWWDHEETALNKKLKKLVANAFDKDENNHESQKNLHTYLWSFFFTDFFEWQATPSHKIELIFQDCLYTTIFSSILITPPTPPPKLS